MFIRRVALEIKKMIAKIVTLKEKVLEKKKDGRKMSKGGKQGEEMGQRREAKTKVEQLLKQVRVRTSYH